MSPEQSSQDPDAQRIEFLKDALAWVGEQYGISANGILPLINDDELFSDFMDRARERVREQHNVEVDSLDFIEAIDWLEENGGDDDPGGGGVSVPRVPFPTAGGGLAAEAESVSIDTDFITSSFRSAGQHLREAGRTIVVRRSGEILEMDPSHPAYWAGFTKPEN